MIYGFREKKDEGEQRLVISYLTAPGQVGIGTGMMSEIVTYNSLKEVTLFELSKGVEQEQIDFIVYWNALHANIHKNNPHEMLRYLDKIKVFPPSIYPLACGYRGHSYYRIGKFDLAIEDYSKAIEIESDNPFAYYNKGIALNKI